MSTPQSALYRLLRDALVEADIVGDRVFMLRADPRKEKPYILFSPAAQARQYQSNERRAFSFDMAVQCVADSFVAASECAALVTSVLNDQGEDDRLKGLTDPDWKVLSITEDLPITMTDNFEDASPAFIEGAIYLFVIEER